MTIYELQNQLAQKRDEYKALHEGLPTKKLADGTVAVDPTADQFNEMKNRLAEIDDLGAKLDILARHDAALTAGNSPVNRPDGGASTKSVDLASEMFKVKQAYGVRGKLPETNFALDMKSFLDFEAKATMTTTAGFAPFRLRDGKVVPLASRPPQMLDLLRVEPTDKDAVLFMQQTTRTNTAATRAENAALPEATIEYTQATVPIQKVGVFLPITEEQIEDELEVRNLVEADLRLMVRQVLDEQITVGDGTAPNLRGAYNATNVQTQANGGESIFNQIMRAMTLVRVTGRANPNLVVLHSTDHQTLALNRTADGLYILGNPADAPIQRVWGVNIALSEALTVGTGMVLDSDFLRLKLRKDVTLAVSDSHASTFVSNVLTMRAHVRAGLQILRGTAICRLTGIPAS